MQRGMKTSRSAVAKRPRDASCLSVVSFNSTKRRVEKLEWLGYPTVKKISKISLFILTEGTNVTDTHTQADTLQTPHDDIGRACMASRCNNRDF